MKNKNMWIIGTSILVCSAIAVAFFYREKIIKLVTIYREKMSRLVALMTLLYGLMRFLSIRDISSLIPTNSMSLPTNSKNDKIDKKHTHAIVNHGATSISLTYPFGEHMYTIYLPFSRSLAAKMINCKVTLLKRKELDPIFTQDKKETEEEDMYSYRLRHQYDSIDITQQPGIPYLVTAKQMNGEKIIVEYEDGTYKEFHKEEPIHI